MNETPIIQLAGLHKRFGAVTAVDGVDLTIHRGEVVALLGPNGAGKTTTVDLALGLATPTAGSVRLFGGAARDAIVDGRVGAMLQGGALLPDLTVRDSVALVASAHRAPMSVDEALRRARCTEIAGRRVNKLSGGQLQRARFAVAVVSDPDLLVLDEPTAAMDVEARHTFWSSMREFTDTGRTVVFATHYLDEADTFADRIVIMRAGRIVADGTPAEIKAIAAARTIRFTGVGPADHDALRGLPGVSGLEERHGTVTLVTDRSDTTLRALLAAFPAAHDIEVVPSTMDDAFLALTRTTDEPSSAETTGARS
ncbi:MULTISPECIES: ABC transporter ATP-binding protein [unclassified Curtobacterium]|uniref:ABC transporter ATP-binding protein n=1 Tax=unclassified Curtobacterium TaxID=257496 RepID=UPI000DA7F6E6|nr:MULTISPECIES: ABC transporter ATP-binding protein [unclassified Curtobacterium]WIB63083.1 ABC transporter ATP-binding protein [Curtobacterium sp. MCBD17_040]WIB66934.1 ABC transporter ATP-binding protein [Curtobacterium sp. MCBD17_035]WIE54079.1 ABC transporter ATP-binding protein [Curtobacterium sp. MCBD17_003]